MMRVGPRDGLREAAENAVRRGRAAFRDERHAAVWEAIESVLNSLHNH